MLKFMSLTKVKKETLSHSNTFRDSEQGQNIYRGMFKFNFWFAAFILQLTSCQFPLRQLRGDIFVRWVQAHKFVMFWYCLDEVKGGRGFTDGIDFQRNVICIVRHLFKFDEHVAINHVCKSQQWWVTQFHCNKKWEFVMNFRKLHPYIHWLVTF